jgi:hypothetical protein
VVGQGSRFPQRIASPVPLRNLTLGGSALCAGHVDAPEWYCLGLIGGERLATPTRWTVNGRDVRQAAAVGQAVVCAVSIEREGFCAGGQFGGTIERPIRLGGQGIQWERFERGHSIHFCGLDIAGAGYCWGSNVSGQVGDGSSVQQEQPVRLPGTWRQLHPGLGGWGVGNRDHTCGWHTDGWVYCWGSNHSVQLGTREVGDFSSSPVRVQGIVRR